MYPRRLIIFPLALSLDILHNDFFDWYPVHARVYICAPHDEQLNRLHTRFDGYPLHTRVYLCTPHNEQLNTL